MQSADRVFALLSLVKNECQSNEREEKQQQHHQQRRRRVRDRSRISLTVVEIKQSV